MTMKIPIAAWAATHYSPPPSIRTLRYWAASGQIVPAPEKVGRALMVEDTAQRLPLASPPGEIGASLSPRARGILQAA